MIELYLIVWTVCSSTGFCVENSTIIRKNDHYYSDNWMNTKIYPIKFSYCEFYGHIAVECSYKANNYRECLTFGEFENIRWYEKCLICKKRKRKIVNESWEWEE